MSDAPHAPGIRRPHANTLREIRAVRLAAVDMLAEGVAHEVNNPLAVIAANVELMGRGIALCRKARRGEPLERAEREDLDLLLADGPDIACETALSCTRIAQVVRRLAAFGASRCERILDLPALVEEVARVAEAAAHDELAIRRQLAAVPPIRGNAGRLSHAILTLVEHARAAARGASPPRCVCLRLAPADLGVGVVLEVADNGPPLTPAERAIFDDPFQDPRHDRTVALGLALARDIIHEHGGTLELGAVPAAGNVRRMVFPAAASEREEAGG